MVPNLSYRAPCCDAATNGTELALGFTREESVNAPGYCWDKASPDREMQKEISSKPLPPTPIAASPREAASSSDLANCTKHCPAPQTDAI